MPQYATLIQNLPTFPYLLPPLPQPHPTPLPLSGKVLTIERRDFVRDAEDLSDEEVELEDTLAAIKKRGESFLIPLGKVLTAMEEKADMSTTAAASDSASDHSHGDPEDHENEVAGPEESENEEVEDLDADMQNFDNTSVLEEPTDEPEPEYDMDESIIDMDNEDFED
ncbi:hypothetical protein BOTBODRAFT_38956, partial [Botryobasidium botryosum FD-172 SS1]